MSTNFEDTKWHSYTSSTETMRTWAQHIKSFEDVPEEFQPAFPEHKDHFPYTLFLPEDKKSKFHQKERKIICQGMVQPDPNGAASGQGIEGELDLSKFDYLDKINFKYMNYGRTSIRHDDSVIDVVYQPEQNIQEISFFSKTLFRRYKTNHLTVLTEQELILIREYKRIRNNFDLTNGGVFIYIPRCKIQDVSFIANQEGSLRTMKISLPENVRLATEFSLAHEELNQLQSFLAPH